MLLIQKIRNKAESIKRGEDPKVRPGQPESFTTAASEGDAIRQGDLYLVVRSAPPDGYVEVKKLLNKDKQLVTGNTQGSRHVLDSLVGVKMFRPKVWNEESLQGPFLILSQANTVTHPTHGHVHIPAGMSIQCIYQREFDKEEKRERRARD